MAFSRTQPLALALGENTDQLHLNAKRSIQTPGGPLASKGKAPTTGLKSSRKAFGNVSNVSQSTQKKPLGGKALNAAMFSNLREAIPSALRELSLPVTRAVEEQEAENEKAENEDANIEHMIVTDTEEFAEWRDPLTGVFEQEEKAILDMKFDQDMSPSLVIGKTSFDDIF